MIEPDFPEVPLRLAPYVHAVALWERMTQKAHREAPMYVAAVAGDGVAELTPEIRELIARAALTNLANVKQALGHAVHVGLLDHLGPERYRTSERFFEGSLRWR